MYTSHLTPYDWFCGPRSHLCFFGLFQTCMSFWIFLLNTKEDILKNVGSHRLPQYSKKYYGSQCYRQHFSKSLLLSSTYRLKLYNVPLRFRVWALLWSQMTLNKLHHAEHELTVYKPHHDWLKLNKYTTLHITQPGGFATVWISKRVVNRRCCNDLFLRTMRPHVPTSLAPWKKLHQGHLFKQNTLPICPPCSTAEKLIDSGTERVWHMSAWAPGLEMAAVLPHPNPKHPTGVPSPSCRRLGSGTGPSLALADGF